MTVEAIEGASGEDVALSHSQTLGDGAVAFKSSSPWSLGPLLVQASGMRFLSMVLFASLILGCESPPPPLPPADHAYESRGVVERMQTRSDDHVMILHEEIPDFIGIDGTASTMHSMSMPFAIGEGVSTTGMKVGSKIGFAFEVRWTGGEPLLVTKVEVLGEGAALELADERP